MPNPSSNDRSEVSVGEIMDLITEHSNEGDDRMAMWFIMKSGHLDSAAPLTTEEGIHMRFELIHELTVSTLLLKATDWLTEDVVSQISWGIWDMTQETRAAAEALGIPTPSLDTMPSPLEYGIQRPQ